MERRITHLGCLPEHDPLLKLISGELRVEEADKLLKATL